MKCQCITSFGEPLQFDERADMKAEGSEIILEILATGVCHTDLHVRAGTVDLGRGQIFDYGKSGVELPRIAGHEIVGRIVDAGPEANAPDTSKGYAIYPWCGCGNCEFCATGDENLCNRPSFLGIYADGGFASHVRISHPKYLFDIGDLDPRHAAPLACSGLTTYAALKKVSGSLKTQPVLIIGAGGLGMMCISMLKALGGLAPVVADIDPAKREAALKAGAKAAFDPNDRDAAKEIVKACGGAPRAVIDFVGAEPTAKFAFKLVRKGGTMINVGLFGGAAPWSLPMITMKSVTIMGSYVGSLQDFGELMELARSGVLDPIPGSTHSLDEAESVLQSLDYGKIIGRAVLVNN